MNSCAGGGHTCRLVCYIHDDRSSVIYVTAFVSLLSLSQKLSREASSLLSELSLVVAQSKEDTQLNSLDSLSDRTYQLFCELRELT